MCPKRLRELEQSERRRALLATGARVVVVWAILFGAYGLGPSRPPTTLRGVLASLGAVVLFLLALAWQTRRILRAEIPQLRAVEALGLVIPLFLVIFASGYASLSAGDPGHFSQGLDRLGALYFTVTVLSTVGFGDITPVSALARTVVMVQMILDLALIATLARFVVFTAKISLHRDDRVADAGTAGVEDS
jgi:hypothetical protein